jgi:hypothetical protein
VKPCRARGVEYFTVNKAGMKPKRIILFVAIFVLAIVAFVLLLPNFLILGVNNVSSSNACINNLRIIDSAKDQWALEHGKTSNDIPTWDDVRPYLGRLPSNNIPVCPSGGTYTLGRVGSPPTCSIGGEHSLQ